MGVHFKPGGAFPFLGLSADELTDTHVDLGTIGGCRATHIHERLTAAASPMRRFRLLEESLLSRLFRPLEHHPARAFGAGGVSICAVVRRQARNADLAIRPRDAVYYMTIVFQLDLLRLVGTIGSTNDQGVIAILVGARDWWSRGININSIAAVIL
jgi:hypothetical protein